MKTPSVSFSYFVSIKVCVPVSHVTNILPGLSSLALIALIMPLLWGGKQLQAWPEGTPEMNSVRICYARIDTPPPLSREEAIMWHDLNAYALQMFQVYLKEHPNGHYAEEARKFMNLIREQANLSSAAFKDEAEEISEISVREIRERERKREQGQEYMIEVQEPASTSIPDTDIPAIDAFISVDQEPEPINMEEVRKWIGYPMILQDAGLQGKVMIRLLVGKEGEYMRHRVIKQVHPIFIEAIERHLHKLRFRPAMQGNKPVMHWTNVPFDFKLDE